jgi:uncharacterized membrane protein
MDIARKLSEGVASWLAYEFACDRASLFSERYMSVPIANILSVYYKAAVHAEFKHPILAPYAQGRGRRPEVDFAVVPEDNFPNAKAFVETKWLGRSDLKPEDILWDLLRLELVAHHDKADALFLLAGKKAHFNRFFASQSFIGKSSTTKNSKLLKLDNNRHGGVQVDNPSPARVTQFKSIFKAYQNLSFTTRLSTSTCQCFPAHCPNYSYQVFVWHVRSPPSTPRFEPASKWYYLKAADEAADE